MSPFSPSFPPQPRVYSRSLDFVGPLFSYCYELFVVPKTVNSFAIKQIRTLAQNTGGGGVSRLCALRASPAGRRVSVANPMFSAVCRLFAASLLSFRHSLPLFSTGCSLFSQNTRGGGIPSGRPAARTRWRKAPLKVQGRYIPGKVKDGEMNSPLQVDGPCHLRAEGYEH